MTDTFSFDETIYHELRDELGEADTAEVLNTFLTDTAAKLTRIEADGQERSVIKRDAHSMKSSAATFGFTQLSQLARTLEADAEAVPEAALRERIGELRRAFEATLEFSRTNLLNAGSGATT
jgi:HPt (histidine-containing phosphotransfer) domain-containing protein